MAIILFFLLITIGYFAGSISCAIITSKLFVLPNPRAEGSLNPGATNVIRLSGKKFGLIVLGFDILKGLLPVLLAQLLTTSLATISFTALATVIGHIYPVFFKFRGGKGVATAVGTYFGLNIFLGAVVAVIWLLVAIFWRYASLSSIITLLAAPFIALFLLQSADVFPPLLFMAVLVIYKHRSNIDRLSKGSEPKINLNIKKPK